MAQFLLRALTLNITGDINVTVFQNLCGQDILVVDILGVRKHFFLELWERK